LSTVMVYARELNQRNSTIANTLGNYVFWKEDESNGSRKKWMVFTKKS
jgi:hypothetical protein